jgi:hypothetical protein
MPETNIKLTAAVNPLDIDVYADLPIDISDIISICKEFSSLGTSLQGQIEYILENGVSQSINDGVVARKSLPFIKNFLMAIIANPYFGEARDQAKSIIELVKEFEEKNKKKDYLIN